MDIHTPMHVHVYRRRTRLRAATLIFTRNHLILKRIYRFRWYVCIFTEYTLICIMHICTCICLYIHTYLYVNVYICIRVCEYAHVCMHTCMWIRIHIYAYVCMNIYMYIYEYVYINKKWYQFNVLWQTSHVCVVRGFLLCFLLLFCALLTRLQCFHLSLCIPPPRAALIPDLPVVTAGHLQLTKLPLLLPVIW